jgi:3-oxoadipate enol-lactonase
MSEALRTALTHLIDALRQLAGLTVQVGPFALYEGTCDLAPDLVAGLCRALDLPLTFDAPSPGRGRDFALVALAARIQRAQRSPALAGLRYDDVADAALRLHEQESAGYRVRALCRPDGTVLKIAEAGPREAPGIVISAPCALSYRLSLPWLGALSSQFRCVAVETRGTSERIDDPEDFDRRGCDVDQQVADLLAVAEDAGPGPVHVMGFCGGATVALAAAAKRPGLVRSLSLWHADIDLGDAAPKTDHQVNLRAMLDLGGESRESADWLRRKLTSGPMTGVPEQIGPLVIRPYATAELFYRYARLAGPPMHRDSRPAAAAVSQPVLVVTSEDDDMAHPDGSRRLAGLIPDTRLVVAEHGHHLEAFQATTRQVSCLKAFLASLPERAGLRPGQDPSQRLVGAPVRDKARTAAPRRRRLRSR